MPISKTDIDTLYGEISRYAGPDEDTVIICHPKDFEEVCDLVRFQDIAVMQDRLCAPDSVMILNKKR